MSNILHLKLKTIVGIVERKKFKMKNLTLAKKLGIIFMLFLLLNASAFVFLVQFISKQQSDGAVINIAGAQRMLSQKMSKESLLLVEGDTSIKESLQATIDRFENGQNDLLNGNKEKGIPQVSNEDIKAQLEKVDSLWNTFQENVNVILSESNKTEVNEALEFIKANNETLLKEANNVVTLLEAESVNKVNQLLIFQVLILILNIGLVILGITLSRKGIVQPILQIVDKMKEVAEGSLRVEKVNESRSDEIGQLGKSFNQMVSNLREIVSTVRGSSEELAAASQEMAASSEEVSAAVSEIARSSEQVASDAEQGNTSAVDASQVLLELSSLIQIAKEKATSATNNSQETLGTAKEGKEKVTNVINSMESIRTKTKETEELISTLDQYSREIEVITETITNIAEQTNLLALNAAIEASRAGEAGKGFAVVAAEVRKLAEQSNQGAGKVSELVKKVTNSTSNAVTVTQHSRKEVEGGVVYVTQAGEALEKILSAVQHTVEDINGIQNITDSESATSDKIIELINNLSTVIENTAANAEEVSAATEESSSSVDTVSASAEQTSAMAGDLKEVVSRFRL